MARVHPAVLDGQTTQPKPPSASWPALCRGHLAPRRRSLRPASSRSLAPMRTYGEESRGLTHEAGASLTHMFLASSPNQPSGQDSRVCPLVPQADPPLLSLSSFQTQGGKLGPGYSSRPAADRHSRGGVEVPLREAQRRAPSSQGGLNPPLCSRHIGRRVCAKYWPQRSFARATRRRRCLCRMDDGEDGR